MSSLNSRRRTLKTILPTISSNPSSSSEGSPSPCHNMSLRKGATFNSPTTPPSEDFDPIIDIPSLPRRSPTCPSKSLEDVIAAGEKRMAEFIGHFERNLCGIESDSSDSQATLRGEDLPVPRGILDAHIPDPDMEADGHHSNTSNAKLRGRLHTPPAEANHHHTSDSGLGSSISGTNMSFSEQESRAFVRQRSQYVPESAITRSMSSMTPANAGHFLGPQACKQIERYILLPILREKRLKDFHPLVQGIPHRINHKEVTCLRDLEKTLLFLAPVSKVLELGVGEIAHYFRQFKKYSASSKAKYINFCEFSIQCIHTAVGFLNERDQRRPADRPYTNGYFLDLVEQIRQYAAMMAASRARERAGEPRNDWDYSPDEEVTLEGGMSQNGRPAELVRRKKGKSLSLRTGEPYDESTSAQSVSMKRSMSEDSTDDSILRSMARRKKNAQPKDTVQRCHDCEKVFKRPCDLTKHEKTHSRPWKCSERSCKYHVLGWPTEKERDRHVNDKHSKAPPQYRCQYHPCTYQSKRESNCKQHMEKAHGWTYIRSKNNGKNAKKTSADQTPQTPNITTPLSNATDFPTPITASTSTAQSPYEPYPTYPGAYSATGSSIAGPSGDFQLFPEHNDTETSMSDFTETYEGLPEFDFNAFEASLQANPDVYARTLGMPEPVIDPSAIASSDFNPHDQDPSYEHYDWNMDADYTQYNMQLMTPAHSVETRPLQSFSRNPSISIPSPMGPPQVPSLSPNGRGNVMLYSPHSGHSVPADEGFEDFAADSGKPTHDFSLFGANSTNGTSSLSSYMTGNDHMIPPLSNNNGGQYVNVGWSGRGTDFAQQMNMNVDEYMQLDDYEQH